MNTEEHVLEAWERVVSPVMIFSYAKRKCLNCHKWTEYSINWIAYSTELGKIVFECIRMNAKNVNYTMSSLPICKNRKCILNEIKLILPCILEKITQ
jgi:hypothetical protein